MAKQLSHIFGSKTKAQEMVLLLQNVKEVVRQGFYEHELFAVEKFCQEQNLHLVRSTFKVLFADEGSSNYSNKGVRIPETDKRPGMYFVYISKDEQKAWLASYHEMMQNHQDLGLALGYPACCVRFFCQNFNDKNVNLQLLPKNPFTNLALRDKDLVILSHFPCSSDCKESIALGEKYLQAIYVADKDRARELLTKLKAGL